MNPLTFLALSIAVGAAIFLLKRPKERSPDLRAKSRRTERNPDREIQDSFEPTWESIDFFPGKERRPAGFVALAQRQDLSLAGTNAPESQAREFIRSADPETASLTVKRDPSNPHDRNAIRIYGHTRPGAAGLPIGWVPAQIAADLNREFSPEMPLAAEVRKAGAKHDGTACFVAINLLGPGAKERKKYLRET